MAWIVIGPGHVYRTRGSTGTHHEQPIVEAIGRMLTGTEDRARIALARTLIGRAQSNLAGRALRDRGHQVTIITADSRPPRGADAYFGLHCDGSVSRSASGASVGYRNSASGEMAREWKRAYARRGWPHGFRGDNYTGALRYNYATRWARDAGIGRAIIVEHGFATNPTEYRWITSSGGLTAAALALVDAVGAVFGHPQDAKEDEGDMSFGVEAAPRGDGSAANGQDAANRWLLAHNAYKASRGWAPSAWSPLEVDDWSGERTVRRILYIAGRWHAALVPDGLQRWNLGHVDAIDRYAERLWRAAHSWKLGDAGGHLTPEVLEAVGAVATLQADIDDVEGDLAAVEADMQSHKALEDAAAARQAQPAP